MAVVRGRPRNYVDHHPRGSEVILVIEVVVTTQRGARQKAPIYAQGGLSEDWIVNVPGRCLLP